MPGRRENLPGVIMEIITKYIELSTRGKTDIIDITDRLRDLLQQSGFREGMAHLFAIGSTTGITTIEYEPGLVNQDLNEMFEKIAPYGVQYLHNRTWGDDNGASHLRSALTGTAFTIPFSDGELILGTWQQVVFIDFDTRPRERRVAVQLLGKKG